MKIDRLLQCMFCFFVLAGCGGSVGGLGDNQSRIVLEADMVNIPADGISSAAIMATITNSSGNAPVVGTAVSFATDLGRFANGDRQYTVTTMDDSGVVMVSLLAGHTAGIASVSAQAGGVSQKIRVVIGFAAGSIDLFADPDHLPADGYSAATLTATVTDSAGQPVALGTLVTFDASLGTFPNGRRIYSVATVSEAGIVTVGLTAGSIAGTAEVSCAAGGASQQVYVVFSDDLPAGGPGAIQLTAAPPSLPADGVSAAMIVATLQGSGGASVAIGTPVTFTTTLGMFANAAATFETATADETAQAYATLMAGTTAGSARVEARSLDVSGVFVVAFEDLSGETEVVD